MDIGEVGIWGSWGWYDQGAEAAAEVATELEELGYGALWLSGGFGRGLAPYFRDILAGTSRLVVASGIISIWVDDAASIAGGVAELEQLAPGRFLLGLGASHAVIVDGSGDQYRHPYSKMVGYLDELDAASPTVSRDRRALAALGPKMLRLSAERSWGAHPYFVPVEHTAFARETMGSGPLLAPEQAVVLETDPAKARAIAREHMTGYLTLPNYTNNLRRFGYTDEDLSGGGSDRLVDAIVAWGDASAVAQRVAAHRAAGADHVCLQILTAEKDFPRKEYHEISAALHG
jgi:probable F420-dependent oxidoreductase